MPLTCEVDEQASLVRIALDGFVTLPEVMALIEKTRREFPASFNLLIDITRLSGTDIPSEQLRAFGRGTRPGVGVAIVARENSPSFARARLFELTVASQQASTASVAVFTSVAEGLEWLKHARAEAAQAGGN